LRKLVGLMMLVLTLASSLSFAGGSRVGNGSGSGSTPSKRIIRLEKLGIETEVPDTFNTRTSDKARIIFEGVPALQNKGGLPKMMPQEIKIMDLNTEFPEIAGLSESELEKWFQDRKWIKISAKTSPCPLVQVGQNSKLMTIIAAWNSTDGVAMVVDNTTQARAAAKTILNSIKPFDNKKEGCKWK